ncbi:MAG: PD-(D/E)XK nuclease family protein, partial [Tannerella sp.]|nr:PD-(D/E)XK nuclease family protein [Tannerella sp.]
MTPFLQQVATAFYRQYGTEIQHLAFVFPNRRAGLFFRKYLARAAGKPLFAPAVLTISGLFFQLSGKQPADRIRLLFLLYRIYIRHSGREEAFDDFVYWGEMLLNDFDDVDKYLVDARRLFTNITDLHDLEAHFDYLNESQLTAIRSFWSSFRAEGKNASQQYFLKIWQLLYAVYVELRETLAAEGIGYEGMIFREVTERIRREGGCELPYRRIVFVGLNALTAAEKDLMTLLQQQGIADFYWDYPSAMVKDPDNKASFFSEDNLTRFPPALTLPAEEEETMPEIELIGIPSRIGQAKQVYPLLKEMLGERPAIDTEEALRTAIVLPDEQLLIPVLHAIPEEIARINVTLGYPLSGAPVASLMESALALQKNLRVTDGEGAGFNYRETLAVLNHPYVASACREAVSDLVREITLNNKIRVTAQEAGRTPLLALIFSPVQEADALSDYLIAVLQELNRAMTSLTPERDEDGAVCMDELEQEFIFHYFTT